MISAIILTGGRGEGFFPFSTVRNKVVFPVLDTPIVCRLVTQVRKAGIQDVTLVTGHHEQSIRHALRDMNNISFIKTKEGYSPADIIRSILNSSSSDETIILYGDIVTTQENLSSFIKIHQEQQNEISVLTSSQNPPPLHTTFFEIDTHRRLKRLLFNSHSSPFWFCGILMGKTKSLTKYFELEAGVVLSVPLGAMPVPEGNLISALDVMVENHCEVSCINAEDFLIDVDHPWDLMEANQRVLSDTFQKMEGSIFEKSAFISDGVDIPSNTKLWIQEGGRIEKGTIIKGNLFVGKNSHISCGAVLEENIFVNSNTRISEYAKIHNNSVIGEHNLILHNAEFYGLTLDTVFMVHACCISGMIGSHVDIGAGTVSATWRFDDKIREIQCKLRKEVPPYHGNLTYLGDYCRTGVNVMFMPGVRIGPYSCIGPGVIVNKDINPYSLVIQQQQLEIKPWGPDRYP